MSALAVVIAKAKTKTAVTSITGLGGLYPIEAPQTKPRAYIIFNIAGGYDEAMISGAGGMWAGRVTCECVADTPDGAVNLGQALIENLPTSDSKETFAGRTDVAISEAETDFTDSSSDRSAFRRTVDFRVRYK